jgi:hypothetical protein
MGTKGILESMLPGVRKFTSSLGLKSHDPEVPLVAIMFRTQDEFNRYSRMPDGIVAYYDVASNRIVMYEESPLFRIRRFAIPFPQSLTRGRIKSCTTSAYNSDYHAGQCGSAKASQNIWHRLRLAKNCDGRALAK